MTDPVSRKLAEGAEWTPDSYGTQADYRGQSSKPPPRAEFSLLERMILDLRQVLRDEVPNRLHASATPRLLNDDGTTDRNNADEGGLGPPLTAQMHRFIGHWSHWGSSRLGTLSIMDVSDWCHARHTGHSRPGSDRSLCAQMLHEVGLLGQEPSDLAWIYGLPLEQVESMLGSALRHAAEWRMQQERRPKGARFDGPDPLPYEPLRLRRSATIAHG